MQPVDPLPPCVTDPVCQALTSLSGMAYMATGSMAVLLASAIFAFFTFRRSDQNRRVFLLPLLSLVPAFLITLQDWEAIGWGGDSTSTQYTVPLLLGTLAIVVLILLMAWVQRFADH